jgi:hypothetical protein
MTDQKDERKEKRQSAKQQRLTEARELHEEYVEEGGSLDFISDMGCRSHAQKIANVLGQPGLYEHCVQVTQQRVQVGLKALDPFRLMFDGTLVQRAQQSENECDDQILVNKDTAEKEKLKKARRNAAGGRISAR